MSGIYIITKKICNKIEYMIRSTFLFTIFLKTFLYLESAWLNSFFKNMYPSSTFLPFLKKSNILKNHIFSPLIVIVAFSIFMILASIPVSERLHINIIIGFLFFFLFSMILPKFVFKDKTNYIKFDSKDINAIGFVLFLIGIVFSVLSIAAAGGIPLLKPALRQYLNPKLTIPAFLIIPGMALMISHILNKMQNFLIDKSAAKFRIISISTICMFLLLLLGYRTPLVAIILIVVIMGYYTNLFEIWEVLGGFVLVTLVILGVGYFRSVGEYSLSNLSALDFLKMRAGFTMHILDLLSNISGFTGVMHGDLTLSMIPGAGSGPRTIIAKLICWRSGVTITPTLFGQMLVDFGTIGVAFGMGILGFILGVGYEILQKTKDSFYIMLYALILAYCIISVETGILDQTVTGYIVLAAIIYLYNIF